MLNAFDENNKWTTRNKLEKNSEPQRAVKMGFKTREKGAKKHILFIEENSLVPLDTRVWAEARAAKEWGYDVSVICPKGHGYDQSYEVVEDIEIYRHPMPVEGKGKLKYFGEYVGALFWEMVLSTRVFFKKRFHVIHGANPPDYLFIVALLFKLFGTKYVFDHHDLSPETYVAKFGRKDLIYRVLLMVEKMNFMVADVVISTNESYRKMAIERGGKRAENVFVVRNGPELDRLYYPIANDRWKNGFDHLVAYIGIISEQENIDVLLRIAHTIVFGKGVKNIKFIIIGRGPHRNEMMRLSKNMRLQDYVEFTGFIPYDKVYEIFATADLCVNPETPNEFTDKSTMIKIMEYMAFGKPIVQFDNHEGKVSAGEASLYIKNSDEHAFADAIIDLAGDEHKRKTMGRIGKERIDDSLHWGHQKIALKNAYQRLFEHC